MTKRRTVFGFLLLAGVVSWLSACGATPSGIPDSDTSNDTQETATQTQGTDTGSSTHGTDTGSDTSVVCEPNFGSVCSFDGRQVVRINSCGVETGVAFSCPVAGVCVSDDAQDPPTARCECAPGFAGSSCEEPYCAWLTSLVKSCQDPAIIGRAVLPMTLSLSLTEDSSNNIDVACDEKAQPGVDQARAVYLFAGEVFNVTLETNTKGAELSLSLFRSGDALASAECTLATQAICSDVLGGTESLSYSVGVEGWYEVVVDSRKPGPSNTVPYTLALGIEHPKPGECYNSEDKLCIGGESVERDWASAEVFSPMVSANSVYVGEYLYTTVAQSGAASTTVSIPCDGYFTIDAWGWTPNGVSTDLPSTFYLSVGAYENALLELGSTGGNWQNVAFPDGSNSVGLWLNSGNQEVFVRGGESMGAKPTEHPALGPVTFTSTPP